MLALRYVRKAGPRDGRGDAMVGVMTIKWYRHRHRHRYRERVRSAPPAAQLYLAQCVYLRSAYRPRARAIVYILT